MSLFIESVVVILPRAWGANSSMEQARDDLAHELASGTPNYTNAVAGAIRYCPLIAHVLRSLEQEVRRLFGEGFARVSQTSVMMGMARHLPRIATAS